jgi:hypothetical protein
MSSQTTNDGEQTAGVMAVTERVLCGPCGFAHQAPACTPERKRCRECGIPTCGACFKHVFEPDRHPCWRTTSDASNTRDEPPPAARQDSPRAE